MKILQLTKKFPYPLKDGESIAVTNLARAFVDLGCEITLLSMNTVKHHADTSKLPSSYNHYHEIKTIPLDNRVTPFGAFKNLFSSQSYHVSRFFFKTYRDELVQLLQVNSYDIIQLETLYLAPYIDTIKAHSQAPIVMRSHNVEFEIWQRITHNSSGIKKKYLQYLTKKLHRFEMKVLPTYDMLVTVTERDFQKYKSLGYTGKGMSSPISIRMADYPVDYHHKEETFSLSFIGSLDWLPNLEGLDWFIDKVWPLVQQDNPGIKLHIGGRNTPESILNKATDTIIVEGEVPSAKAFIQAHDMMIVPLLSGSGMRVKILEGMALGNPIVTTSIGMEGIAAKDKQQILIADTIQEFASKINWAIENKGMLKQLGENARAFISRHFDRDKNAQLLLDEYRSLIIASS